MGIETPPSGGSRTAARRTGRPQLSQLSPLFGLPGGREGRVWRTQLDLLTAQQRYRKCQVDIGGHVQAVPVTPEGEDTGFGTSSPLASAMTLGSSTSAAGLLGAGRGDTAGAQVPRAPGAIRHTCMTEPTCAVVAR